MFIADGHLDIAYNAIRFNRDFFSSVNELRIAEKESPTENGLATVAFPELMSANVGLVFGSVFLMPASSPLCVKAHSPTTFVSREDAYAKGMIQMDFYHKLAAAKEEIHLVVDSSSLTDVVCNHEPVKIPKSTLGILISMEGATSIRSPGEIGAWYSKGLRVVGLAWDDTPYAPGTFRQGGALTLQGRELLKEMAYYKMIADVSHMAETASMQVLNTYPGFVVATHSNVRAIVPGHRQLSDRQILEIAKRGGIVGIALFNGFLRPGYTRSDNRESVTLDYFVDHIDHICQLVGSPHHVGIGSDLDGGFGRQQIPAELDSVADFPLIMEALERRGYSSESSAAILGGNWVNLLRIALAD